MGILKSALGLPFVKSWILGQGRLAAAGASAWLFAHDGGQPLIAGFTQSEVYGALACLVAVGLQSLDNLVVHNKAS